MTTSPTTSERRAQTRKRCLFKGRILFEDKITTLDCMVRNISDDGALIETEALSILPAGFSLRIDAKGVTRAGHIRWKRPGKFGIALGEFRDVA
ncbi:MAG: PilZ domain-containing protein [Rhizobiales bacterium]|nr:PilZ domain-containing protein [Hyphomicrobiales bacterium]